MSHGLSFAGLNLAAPHIRARDLSGALTIPERLGENVPVAGRHGTVRVPRKRYGGRLAPFEVRVYDCTPAGAVAADPRVQLEANLSELGRVLALDSGLLVHTLPDGTVRQITAECRAAVEPTRTPADTRVVVPCAFESHEAFWRAPTATTSALTLTSGAATLLPAFAAGSAPIDDLVITFGPGPAPTLTDVPSGRFIAYDAPIGAGQTLVLDGVQMRGYGTGGLVFDRRKLRAPDGWFELTPVRGSAPTVRLTITGATTMPVTFSGRLAWIFG